MSNAYNSQSTGDEVSPSKFNEVTTALGRITDVGLYPMQQYDYVVFKIGSTYYRRNGSSGEIDDSNSSFHTLMNTIYTALTSGGKVGVAGGSTYTVAGSLTPNSNTWTDGIGRASPVLRANGNHDIVLLGNVSNVKLTNLKLDGATNQTTKGGIYIQSSDGAVHHIYVDDTSIQRCAYGLYGENTVDNKPYAWHMDRCWIHYSTVQAMFLPYSAGYMRFFNVNCDNSGVSNSGSYLVHVEGWQGGVFNTFSILNSDTGGFYFKNPQSLFMFGCNTESCNGTGLYIEAPSIGQNVSIIGGYYSYSKNDGIYLEDVSRSRISLVNCRGNGADDAGNQAGITLSNISKCVITNNTCFSNDNYGIYLKNAVSKCIISNNMCYDAGSGDQDYGIGKVTGVSNESNIFLGNMLADNIIDGYENINNNTDILDINYGLPSLDMNRSHVYKKTVNWDDSSPVTVCNVKNGSCVTDVWVHVTTTFDGSVPDPAIDIGDGGNPDGFLETANIDHDTTGYYGFEADDRGAYLWDSGNTHRRQKIYTSDDTIDATLTQGGSATQGICDVYVKMELIRWIG